MHNENLMLLPYNYVSKNGKTQIDPRFNNSVVIHAYHIHDNFMDLRSRSKAGQLYAATMIASFQGKIVLPSLLMTN